MTSVVCINTKFPQNVGGVIRACACFGVEELRITGRWTQEALDDMCKERIPREERMKGYNSVNWKLNAEKPLNELKGTPICVELVPNAIPLPFFEHPDDAIYLFGPEDGSVPQVYRRLCHSFVVVPTAHCMNLAATVYVTLYDRRMKRIQAGLEDGYNFLKEERFTTNGRTTVDQE